MHTTGSVTHEVTNQAPPLTGHDVADDPVLLEGVRREEPRGTCPSCTASAATRAARRPSTGPTRPTATSPNCAPTTATATASTRSSSTPRTTP